MWMSVVNWGMLPKILRQAVVESDLSLDTWSWASHYLIENILKGHMWPKAKPSTTAGISPRLVLYSPWNYNHQNSLEKSFHIIRVKKPEALEWSSKKLFKTPQQNATSEINGWTIQINSVRLQPMNTSSWVGKTISCTIMLCAELICALFLSRILTKTAMCTVSTAHLTAFFSLFP